MLNDAFAQEILHSLDIQKQQYPAMAQEDAVKLAFQAMLGVGHLLSDRKTVTDYIIRETDGLEADPDEPLLEQLSPAWCRINLRRAMADRIPPSVIAGMMITSHPEIAFARQDVYDLCACPALSEKGYITDRKALDMICDPEWLPSHSAEYREMYHPAYRVIPAVWASRMDAVRQIAAGQCGTKRLLVTLDGPCASGKTTLAAELAEVFGACVIHTDDYVIPHAQKTPERLSIPGGNCDADRLAKEVAAPWKQGSLVRYRRYDCRADRLLPEEELPDSPVLIIEGSYCNLPVIRQYADVRLFDGTPEEIRMARLKKRESEASLRMFMERWIPLENAYFEAYHLPDAECLVLE